MDRGLQEWLEGSPLSSSNYHLNWCAITLIKTTRPRPMNSWSHKKFSFLGNQLRRSQMLESKVQRDLFCWWSPHDAAANSLILDSTDEVNWLESRQFEREIHTLIAVRWLDSCRTWLLIASGKSSGHQGHWMGVDIYSLGFRGSRRSTSPKTSMLSTAVIY